MSHPLLINRLILAVCGAWLLVAGACADDVSSNVGASQSVALHVTIKKGETIGTDQVQRAIISAGTNEFLVVVPGGARVNVPTQDRVTFIPTDYRYYLSFRVINTPEAATSDYYRDLLLSRYPGAKIIDESSGGAAGHSGPVFELQWTTTGGVTEVVRVAFIPSPAGILEFSLVADQNKSSEGRSNFKEMLMTFRSNENGKLVIVPFPSDS